jgi:hypothetical protein
VRKEGDQRFIGGAIDRRRREAHRKRRPAIRILDDCAE